LALVVAALAIVLLAVRPRQISGWIWPAAGALLLVLLGDEPIAAAGAAIGRQWNVLLFIFGLMAIAACAEASGAFAWIADLAITWSRGSRRRLFVMLFAACALVTLLLSNDATAIVLTPIVYDAVSTRARGEAKPFLFACVFAANTASFGLPFSNPANVLILPHARLLPYLWHLGLPQLAAIAINLGIFLFFFRRQLEGRFEPGDSRAPSGRAIRTLCALAAVGTGYFVALALAWPLGPVAIAGAALAFVAARADVGRVAHRISWKTLAILAALFVLLDAVTRAGFVSFALVALDHALHYGSFAAIAAAAGGAALLSNAFNNLPIAVAASYVVSHVASASIAYPLIVGVDLGPNLLTTGSIATILWLAIVRSYGIRVTLGEYARLGALVVPATLVASVAWLYAITL
jgi:arsenical pump membrane protein